MKLIKNNFIDFVLISFLLFLSWLVFFKGLGRYSLRLWDEGRNAVNALEMLKNGNFLVTSYNSEPDMWNTKPPLLIWIMSLSFKIWGENELAVRMPSAISASIVVFVLYFWLKVFFKNSLVGFLASLIILSSMGFPDWHIGRTGDYDALLTLLVFLASIYFFRYTEFGWKRKDIFYSCLFFGLAILTKGVAGILVVPGIVIYLLISRNLIKIIKDVNFWKSFLVLVLLVGLYYGAREMFSNGYLAAVWKNEIMRSVNLADTGENSFWYYWKFFKEFRFQKWIYFAVISLLSIFLTNDKKIKKLVIFYYVIGVSYFFIISTSVSKYLWYDAQLYPFMSILVAIFIYLLIKKTTPILRVFMVFVLVYYMQRYIRTNIAFISRPDLEKEISCLKYGYVFRNNIIDQTTIGVHQDFCTPLDFYLLKNKNKRKKIEQLSVGDKVLSCEEKTMDLIDKKYKTEVVVKTEENCVVQIILKNR